MLLDDHEIRLVTAGRDDRLQVQIVNAFGTLVMDASIAMQGSPQTSSLEAAVRGLSVAADLGYETVEHEVDGASIADKLGGEPAAADAGRSYILQYQALRAKFDRVDVGAV